MFITFTKEYYSTLRRSYGTWFGTRMRKASAVTMSNLFTLVIGVQRQQQSRVTIIFLWRSVTFHSSNTFPPTILDPSTLLLTKVCVIHIVHSTAKKADGTFQYAMSFGTRPSSWILL
jgi:hypothetical protein